MIDLIVDTDWTGQLLCIAVILIAPGAFLPLLCASKKKVPPGPQPMYAGQPGPWNQGPRPPGAPMQYNMQYPNARPGVGWQPPPPQWAPPPPPRPGGELVAADDPNYMTLADVHDNVFQKKDGPMPGNSPRLPQGGGQVMVAADDPNYMTLAAVNDKVFEEGGGGGGDSPRLPAAKPMIAASDDPNYMTLAAINDNVFDEKIPPKGTAGGPRRPTAGGQRPFSPMRGGASPRPGFGGYRPMAPPPPRRTPGPSKPIVVASDDPNYMTLAAVQDNIFDQKR